MVAIPASPCSEHQSNHATRFFILGAREDSVVELRPHTAAAAAAPAAADTAASQPPPQQDQRSLDLDTVTSTSMDGATAAATAAATGKTPAAATSVPSRQQLTRQGPRPTAPPHDGAPYDIDSPVHLLRVRGLSPRYNTGCLGVDLRHVVSGPLQLALVSNYMIDMGWLLSCCPDLAKARQFFVVHGEGPDAEPEMRQQAAEAGAAHVRLHRPPLPIMYGTHHSKAFLLAYSTGLRLIIHTANCVYPDCNDKTQGLWVQDFPRKDTVAAAAPVSTFEQDLVAYFRALALPPAMANPLFEAIAMHDFSFARGTLVASVPGYHRGTAAVQSYGHMRLRRLLEQVPLPSCFAAEGSSCGTASSSSAVPPEGLIIQCSSMGSFDQAWLVDEMGASLAACRRQPPPPPPPPRPLAAAPPPRPSGPPGCGPLPLAVVWPTVEEVRNSIEGWNAGRSIPGPSRNVSKPFMGRYYARWGGEAVGRQRAMPHIKTYTRYRGQQLAWFLVTSHNLSKAAWGELQKNGSQLMIRSYELGVLVTPALEAAYRAKGLSATCLASQISERYLANARGGASVIVVRMLRPVFAALSAPLPALWYRLTIGQSSCSFCFDEDYGPVCTTAGVTLPSACLAACQGLRVARKGLCQGSDPLPKSLAVNYGPPPAFWGPSGDDGSGSGSGSGGGGGGDATPPLAESGRSARSAVDDDVIMRFVDDSFVYVGHAVMRDTAPSGVESSGFVGSLAGGTGYRDFTFSPGKVGYSSPLGVIRAQYVTFYRAEYPRIDKDGVNYFDMALIRMQAPSLSYMGLKYSCTKTDYPKVQTCGYPYDRTGFYLQKCDDCYYTSNACNPMVQPINWCFTVGGQSGSAIYDLSDYQILGILSGGPNSGMYFMEYSVWTPIDAIHFASLKRWLWKSGTPAAAAPLTPPLAPAVQAPYTAEPCGAQGLLRLVASSDVGSGRVEICYNGVWGTVCSSSSFNNANARVVCRSLGFLTGSWVVPTFFNPADLRQSTWVELGCTGNENGIFECPPLSNGNWSVGTSCATHETADLSVMCRNTNEVSGSGTTPDFNRTTGFFPCTNNGAVRLRDNLVNSSGRVEYCNDGRWGTICHDGWDDRDATVVCRQLGYRYGIAQKGLLANGASPPGSALMRIWMQQVNCSGSEAQLQDCGTLVPLGATDCSHRADAGVMCANTPFAAPGVPYYPSDCSEPGALRVVDDGDDGVISGYPGMVGGRLEVCYAGQWGAVCEPNFNDPDARVACRQMGFGFGRAVPATRQPGSTPGDLRLRGGVADNLGRLEVCSSGAWGSVCEDGFGQPEADVACRLDVGVVCFKGPQQPLPAAVPPPPADPYACPVPGQARVVDVLDRVTFGAGRLEICLNGVWGTRCGCGGFGNASNQHCSPRMHHFWECPVAQAVREQIDRHIQPSQEAATGGITRKQLWLVQAPTGCEQAPWDVIALAALSAMEVCGQGFGTTNAIVACRHLGFTTGVVVYADDPNGFGSGSHLEPVHLGSITCKGQEDRLTSCPSRPVPDCPHA
ncbi:hypothetical protein VOLCADRAFT_88920 [Volvox carteri f. nagariensis]|uniref:SRCR domain-containing protein n=1 Tax=Volvox carteri f. nagariensis TaxID=3068 RepID=D8TQB2_VOLCA|nr:uncharacterized protein VOLCADRAFT_88920 [Volvox carteri f. nagariensis]EFJ50373.1 hypothetical protein VOLCADRAFT_88920 [Volvox carteri f. nagariensis]|eukprot:XP_002948498.1 hypothetical protein VOLCADRAFT_88920 [Volvox carteri f. nagariensis]